MVKPLEQITLEVAGAAPMQAQLARPAGSARAGILLLQEAFGVNDHMRELARRFAAAGYLAVVPDLYHRSATGFTAAYDDIETARAQMALLTDAGLTQDLKAARHWLVATAGIHEHRIASVGFCLGGYVSFLAALTLPLAAAVSFYGVGIPRLLERLGELSAPMLFFWGGQDHAIDAQQRRLVIGALDRAEKPYTHVLFSATGHGFFCDQRASYNHFAAVQAWALTEVFLAQRLAA